MELGSHLRSVAAGVLEWWGPARWAWGAMSRVPHRAETPVRVRGQFPDALQASGLRQALPTLIPMHSHLAGR